MIVGLVLAAGASSRFGRPKQLELFRGRTFLEIAIENVSAGCDICYVALGAEVAVSSEICKRSNAVAMEIPDWKSGQRQSLKVALHHILKNHTNTQGVLVGLCDQVLLTPDHYRQLRDDFIKNHQTVATEWSEGTDIIRGAPVLWKAQDLQPLLDLEIKDVGAQNLLNTVPHTRIRNASARWDIDRPDDLLVAQSFDGVKS